MKLKNNRPTTDRSDCKTDRWNQITDNLPASRRNLPMINRPIIVRRIRGIDRFTKSTSIITTTSPATATMTATSSKTA
jgi:hypothetical protein